MVVVTTKKTFVMIWIAHEGIDSAFELLLLLLISIEFETFPGNSPRREVRCRSGAPERLLEALADPETIQLRSNCFRVARN